MTVAGEKIETPLARARGLGSAHEGAGHWWHQRVTAVTNLFLMAWLAWSVVRMPSWDYGVVHAWLAIPVNAVLMTLAIISAFYHAALGAQVIVEDYVHNEGFKILKLAGLKLFLLAAGVACVFAILKVAFSG